MAKYAIDGQDTNTANTTILGVSADGTTPRRQRVYDYVLGSGAAPADGAGEYAFERFTAAGTSTAVTPSPLDPADAVALADAGEAHSGEPTYANVIGNVGQEPMLLFSLNQRATFRWVASPGGELVIPATAAAGLGTRVQTVQTPINVENNIHFNEE